MKIPTKLLWRVLLDVRLQPSDTIERDLQEIEGRYQREGWSFLTITLPRLDDALLQGLSRGRLLRSDYVGFRSRKRGSCLPALLQGFYSRIFDNDGWLLDCPDVCAISAIRQVARLFKKVEKPCTDKRIRAAYERYESNDQSLVRNIHRSECGTNTFVSVASYLWSDLEELSRELYCFPGLFGSGATAERKQRNARLSVTEWPERSERSFPATYHAVSRVDSSALAGLRFLELEEELPVRVVQVPKTLKTPRTISVEPSYMMLMQQSIAKPLVAYLESSRFPYKSIRFTDQTVNKDLARRGSIDGSLATIDLSDASDLVSNDLVSCMFGGCAPTFLDYIQDCRSRTARLPDGTNLSLQKFASMGSALCFPIEAMVFFTIVMYSLVRASGERPSRRLLRKIAEDVAVYGDDIIVPAKMAPVVMETLEAFGLRVNRDKSFHTGLFRESCGGDYYNGVDVTPAYVRHWDDTGALSSPSHVVAYAALSNILYMKGMWHACQSLREHLDYSLRRPLPYSSHPIGCLHFYSFHRSTNLRWSEGSSGYRVKGYRPTPKRDDDSPTDLDGFLRGSLGRSYFNSRFEHFRRLFLQGSTWDPYPLLSGSARPGSRDFGSQTLERGICGIDFSDDYTIPSSAHGQSWKQLNLALGLCHISETDAILDCYRVWNKTAGLEHLDVELPHSLYESERPYSLCLKSKWTASPAGLRF